MPKLDDQISTLQERLAQLKLRQQRIDARKRAIAAERDRKIETRRRILAGTVVLDKLSRGELDRQQVMAWLEEALTRPADRALFELPPRAGTIAAAGEPAHAPPNSVDPRDPPGSDGQDAGQANIPTDV